MKVNDIATQQTVHVASTSNGNKVVTSVLYKPTDYHSYLLFSYSHTKRSIPFSQILHRICSEEDFQAKGLEIRHFFVQHGYPTSLLNTAFSKASQIPQAETLTDYICVQCHR